MSRIQDILAKAERDGTARRTQGATATAPPPSATLSMVPGIDGSAALVSSPFVAAAPPPAPVAEMRPAPAARLTTRTAPATLHPALVAAIEPHSVAAEEYRAIRSRLTQRDDQVPLRIVLVTSPGARDGKSVTAANLALAMAQDLQGAVLLIDANFRAPSVHALFGVEGAPGLADVLDGEVPLEEALVHLPDHRLTLLPAGSTPQFPTELLGSTAMRRVLDTLRDRFDRIVLDMPPVAPLADVGTVAPLADGALVVVRAGFTQRPALDEALAALDSDKVVGVVLNDVS